jgi:serine/threonine protein kinase
MTTRSQDVAQFMIMTLRPSWEKERLGKRLSSTRYFSSDRFSSEVHKAIQRATGKVVALKRILMHNEKEGMPVTALREIKILKALKHPCIINIVDMIVVRG